MMRWCGLGVLLAVAFPAYGQDSNKFFFQPKDRIVFLGDSITEQYQYSSYIELYLTTRFPKGAMTFINAGIGGDTANGGASRFQAHVLAEKPTAVTINFGMNDGGYGAFNPDANKNFVAKTEAMLEMAKKAGVRVALLSPNAVDRRVSDRFNLYLETQKEFYAPLKDIAAKFGTSFVDQYAKTRTELEKMEQDDPKAAKVRPFGDGFHTSSPGGLQMAHAILTGLHAPALVSDVSIEGGQAKTRGCAVSELKVSDSEVSFERADEAIPLPIQKDWLSVVPYLNDLKDLNWYGIQVGNLTAGQYAITIDDKEVGRYSADALAKGVNLGNVQTGPIFEQGNAVLQAINAKNSHVHARFRTVVMFQAPDWLKDVVAERKPQELAKRTALIEKAQAAIYEAVQPKTHRWTIRAVK